MGGGPLGLLALEATRVDRKLRLTNQGICGTNTHTWVGWLLADALQEGDGFAFVQLGTNDRGRNASGTTPAKWSDFYKNMDRIIGTLTEQEIEPVVLCSCAAVDGDAANMSRIRSVLHRFAYDKGIDFIDQFAATRMDAAGYMSPDKIHPNDAGHRRMFENIFNRIEGM